MTNTNREYDNNGNLIHYRNSTGHEWWNEYDTNGRLIHTRTSGGYEWWHEYDNNGNEIHYRDSTGLEVWYEYDDNGKLIHRRDSFGYEEWYERDINGILIHTRKTNMTNKNGEYTMSNISEQVRKLEEKLRDSEQLRGNQMDTLRCYQRHLSRVECQRDAAESRLAQVRVEGAREALELFAFSFTERLPVTKDSVRQWRDRVYPATCRPTPSPVERLTLATEYSRIDDGKVVWLEDERQRLVITPDLARRIVSLAAQDGGAS